MSDDSMVPGSCEDLPGDVNASKDLEGVVGMAEVSAVLDRPASRDHIAHFYEGTESLVDHVSRFLEAGLSVDERVFVVATAPHRRAFSERLAEDGHDVDRLIDEGRLTFADADETLAQLMVGAQPSWDHFRQVVGGLLGGGDEPVRVYGEMVDVLWRRGEKEAAIQLEGLWNELLKTHDVSLLCAYAMGSFYKTADAADFHEVCDAHSHVIPTEGYTSHEAPESRLREIAELQQRARSLEGEKAHRRELEIALREALRRETLAREKAERDVHFNEMFAGILGHDLRNPLGTIAMGATYIARLGAGEKSARAATRILSSTERMSRMIDQLLDFTRIRAGGGFTLSLAPTDLTEICFRIKDELEAANPDHVVAMETRGDTSGCWDHDRLLQVFSNLAGNAIAHGSADSRVSLDVDGSDGARVVALVHNGGVVPSDVLPVMFEALRGTRKRHDSKGLGLGLYITRQIVLAHGGSIDVSSSVEGGTTVRVLLPRRPPEARPPGKAES